LKTKGERNTKVNVVTLGCAKNLVDSEVLISQLRGNKIDVSHESKEDDANVVIVNTCGFIANAKEESINTILSYVDLKEKGKIDKLFVTGCLSERYKDDLVKEIPEVNEYFGTNDLRSLLKKFNADYKKDLIGENLVTTDNHFAYLKISEGCDRPCSFCAIPLMRGKHRSRPMEDLVKEAEVRAKNGTKELLLIAQDSTYYGLDIYRKRNLSELLKRLSDVEGIEWIRLHYAFPAGFPKDVLSVMNERENICNYLDIPLQHGSSKMLKLMRRGITREKTENLLHEIRNCVPDIAIRTTMITGHPGESPEDFDQLMDFVEKCRFERLGVFTYSHEEQTHSFTMEDDVPEPVKAERANALMELQQQISFDLNQKYVDRTLKVLIDRMESGKFVGRTEFDSPEVDNEVIIDAQDTHLRIGDFTNIHIYEATEFDLFGTPARTLQKV
jgi:ribosomal protein S12 methylthiotransferase